MIAPVRITATKHSTDNTASNTKQHKLVTDVPTWYQVHVSERQEQSCYKTLSAMGSRKLPILDAWLSKLRAIHPSSWQQYRDADKFQKLHKMSFCRLMSHAERI
jgi:hypothetical protein